jgi:hypothetical protein
MNHGAGVYSLHENESYAMILTVPAEQDDEMRRNYVSQFTN